MSEASLFSDAFRSLVRKVEQPLKAVVSEPVGTLGRDVRQVASTSAGKAAHAVGGAADPEWYRNSVFYEVRLGSFKDSNGDGVGDFKGLTGKLDYLKKLGVDTLWLLPFYPSPMKDDGYDIANYMDVNPAYGTLKDFKNLVDEAHKRGMKVVTELVINHTSDQHPWFQRAIKAPAGSAERNFYLWSDTPEKFKGVRVIFNDTEKSNWAWNDQAKAYYYHRFFSAQPDLNYDNPEVKKAVKGVVDHWLNLGVDGLRLDAVPYLFKREGTQGENLPETHAFLQELRQHIDQNFPNRMLLAEANMMPEETLAYFGDAAGKTNTECQMAFNFPVMPRLYQSLAEGNRNAVQHVLEQLPELPPGAQWANFLRNHDELTLEKVTPQERQQLWEHYSPDPNARINLGIRRRLSPLLNGDRRQIELMNKLLLSMPGTPVLYYGDEIGMGDKIALADRNGVRTPMQWADAPNAGFSTASPDHLALPVVDTPGYDPHSVNVAAQEKQKNSLLKWTRKALSVRSRSADVFGKGDLQLMTPSNQKVLAYVRSYKGQDVLVVANMSDSVETTDLALGKWKGQAPRDLWTSSTLPTVGSDPYKMTLGPYEARWIQLSRPKAAAKPAP